MMCPRCNGFLVRDMGFQHDTHEGVAYHCLNCGNYIDKVVLHNRQLTLAERNADVKEGKHIPKRVQGNFVGDDTYPLFGLGSLFLGSGGICDTV